MAWVSPDLAPFLKGVDPQGARNWAPPSDHAPVTLRIGGVTPSGLIGQAVNPVTAWRT